MRKIMLIILVILLLFGVGLLGLRYWFLSGGLSRAVIHEVLPSVVTSTFGASRTSGFFDHFLGVDKPHTYLLLFLNNTELRPGGGFIGVYAIVKVDKGIPKILKLEGSEVLDNLSSREFVSTPPAPLARYLGIRRFEFRDSNWSPDFARSAEKVLELYGKEQGLAANEITSVIGITPTTVEEFLKLTGPIKVGEQEFTAENFTRNLEYEVEFGYASRGVAVKDRKKIIADLTTAFFEVAQHNFVSRWPQFFALGERMLAEKQVMAYTKIPELQQFLEAKGWAGRMVNTPSDYVLWADANLGALKTDAVIERRLNYRITPVSSSAYLATVTMTYVHHGVFDKFTTRYRTYSRVFVPQGSQFKSAEGARLKDRSLEKGQVDEGDEGGYHWFGAFTSIEPGQTGQLSFSYLVSPQVVAEIKSNQYHLAFQKELGTVAVPLTLALNFDKKVLGATPGEKTKEYGDNRYFFNTELRRDQNFVVLLAP